MTIAQRNSYVRQVPLHGSDEHQHCDILEMDEVPEMPLSARLVDANPRMRVYQDGRQQWVVSPTDKLRLFRYYHYRDQADIDAGAYHLKAQFNDGTPL